MGERVGVSDEEWALIGPLLPPEQDRGRVEAMYHIYYLPSRHMHYRMYGP